MRLMAAGKSQCVSACVRLNLNAEVNAVRPQSLRRVFLSSEPSLRIRAVQPSLITCLAPRERRRPAGPARGDEGAGADIGPLPDRYRRHQCRVRADEGALADV